MSFDDERQLESEAIDRLDQWLEAFGDDLHLYWHWGDGEGGYLLERIRNVVVSKGRRWPLDEREPTTRRKDKIGRSLSKRVFERDAYRCVTCSDHIDLCCDHIVPESKGGPTTFENLQTMCRPCNSKKGNRV